MRTTTQLLLLFIVLVQCDKDDCESGLCQQSDKRMVGTWRLVEECECFTMGGDFIWHPVADEFIFRFDDECNVSNEGENVGTCSNGKYSITQSQLTVMFNCPGGDKSENIYSYSFSARNDTLILRGYIDEGHFGAKYHRQ